MKCLQCSQMPHGLKSGAAQSWLQPGLENLQKWEGIFQSGNFDKTGKIREFYPKYWKNNSINNLGEMRMFIGYLSTNILLLRYAGHTYLSQYSFKSHSKTKDYPPPPISSETEWCIIS